MGLLFGATLGQLGYYQTGVSGGQMPQEYRGQVGSATVAGVDKPYTVSIWDGSNHRMVDADGVTPKVVDDANRWTRAWRQGRKAALVKLPDSDKIVATNFEMRPPEGANWLDGDSVVGDRMRGGNWHAITGLSADGAADGQTLLGIVDKRGRVRLADGAEGAERIATALGRTRALRLPVVAASAAAAVGVGALAHKLRPDDSLATSALIGSGAATVGAIGGSIVARRALRADPMATASILAHGASRPAMLGASLVGAAALGTMMFTNN
jgi:hypothetical protein